MTATAEPRFAGAAIARGPMAHDHFTTLHNEVFRGAIHPRYVGVLGFIASHRAGWRLTERSIASALGVGRDYVSSALRHLAERHYLIRTQTRGETGTWGEAIWWITDLPAQIRGLGIDDEDVIERRVHDEFDAWLQRTTQPDHTPPEEEDSSRSQPGSGFPAPASPAADATISDENRASTEGAHHSTDHQQMLSWFDATAREAGVRVYPRDAQKRALLVLLSKADRQRIDRAEVRGILKTHLRSVMDVPGVWIRRLEILLATHARRDGFTTGGATGREHRSMLPTPNGCCAAQPGDPVPWRLRYDPHDPQADGIPCPRCHPDSQARTPTAG